MLADALTGSPLTPLALGLGLNLLRCQQIAALADARLAAYRVILGTAAGAGSLHLVSSPKQLDYRLRFRRLDLPNLDDNPRRLGGSQDLAPVLALLGGVQRGSIQRLAQDLRDMATLRPASREGDAYPVDIILPFLSHR
jgi:hypothetical protein